YNVHGQKSKSDDRARAEDQDPEGKRQLQPKRKGKFGNDIHEVHCGTNHTVFLKKNQSSDAFGYEVYTTGLGNQGRLGVGPGSLSGGREEDDQEMVELDIWWSRSGPIKTMFPWTSGTRALHVACGADHTLCLATDGHVYAWGVNSHGQCGTGSSAAWHRKPTRVQLPKDHAMVSHMAAGAQHSLAIIDGVVFTWGNGRNGRLGTSQSDDCRAPMDIEITHEHRMAIVAGGEAHSGAIDKRGRVYMWGAGDSGRLGFPESLDVFEPKLVWSFDTTGVTIKALALGGFHSLFLEASPRVGNLYSCGSGAAVGQLVEGERRCVSVPVALQLPSKVLQIAAGMFHSMALLEKGLVYSWGVGAHGRLGHGSETTLWAPKALPMPTETEVQKDQIVFIPHDVHEDTDSRKDARIDDAKLAYVVAELSCGSTHAFARTHGGFLYGWGCDSTGQLGFAGEEGQIYYWVPKQLDIGRVIKQVCCGHEFTLAVTMSEELSS
ncbi:UVR8, partial [Symbiodinium necroappetens]